MKKQQYVVVAVGVVLLVILYFFGSIVPPKKASNPSADSSSPGDHVLSSEDILQASKAGLSKEKLSYVNRLEHSVVRGDVKAQQIAAYRQLADFWKDSVSQGYLPAAYYIGELAKLENSEKSLTFAAQLFLNSLRAQTDPALKQWMATEAKQLFEKALELNPANDSTKVGLGAVYIFGSIASSPQEVMQGIQRILEVARRDSTNMYAEYMLGLGGIESGQFDKAIERLGNVVKHEPANLKAILTLAEAYERKGDKASAIEWYNNSKKLVRNPEMTAEIDQHIKTLK